jgi:stress response protein YsnF
MLSERDVSTSIGSTAYGANGDKLGTVESFFVDDRTGAPTWVAVLTGLFGTRQSIVPAVDATFDESRGLRLPVTADAVKSAPQLSGDHLSPEDEDALRRHYAAEQAAAEQSAAEQSDTGQSDTGQSDTGQAGVAQADVAQPAAGRTGAPGADSPAAGTDGAMTRSEERLVVGTERAATTRARLVKYVVTEEVQITVPIRREEIRVEEVPIDAPDLPGESLAGDGRTGTAGATTAAEFRDGGLPDEIVLHAERPVVTVEVVPVERVRLRTEVVPGQETVTQQLQREEIAVDQHAVPPNAPRRAAPNDTGA